MKSPLWCARAHTHTPSFIRLTLCHSQSLTSSVPSSCWLWKSDSLDPNKQYHIERVARAICRAVRSSGFQAWLCTLRIAWQFMNLWDVWSKSWTEQSRRTPGPQGFSRLEGLFMPSLFSSGFRYNTNLCYSPEEHRVLMKRTHLSSQPNPAV